MFSVSQVVQWTGGRLVNAEEIGVALEQIQVRRPASLGISQATDMAFFFSKLFQGELPSARPGILITGEDFVKPLASAGLPFWKTTAVIACRDPYLAMAVLSEKFAEKLSTVAHTVADATAEAAEMGGKPRIHSTAVVHPTADLGAGVQVGAHAVIEEGARVGAGSVIYPGCFIGPNCVVGEYCVLFPNVVLYECTELGNRVRIHASSVLGSDGFGYAPRVQKTSEGAIQVLGHQKIFHLGRVLVGDDVEIGANSCVDRGTIADTVIGKNSKLDNLVHLGHNSRLDEGAIICGGTCLAGNASVGKYAYVGGLTGITNHVHVGDGAKVGALALLTKDVPPGGTAVGNPQREHKEHFRAHALLSRMLEGRRSRPTK